MSDNEPKKLSNPILSAKLPPPIVGKQANPPKEFAKNPKIGKVGIPKGVKMNIVGKFSNGPPKFPPPQAKVPALSIPKQGIDTNEDGNKVSPPSNQEVKKIIPKRTSSLQGSVLKESMHVKTSSFPSPREISFSNSYDSIPSFSSDDFSSESSLEESSSSDRKKSVSFFHLSYFNILTDFFYRKKRELLGYHLEHMISLDYLLILKIFIHLTPKKSHHNL